MGWHTPAEDYAALPEQELQRRYHAGDQQALGELWRRHEASLQKQAYVQSGGNREVAEEALGRLRVRLAQREVQEGYDPDQPWRPWVRKILKNLVRDVLRDHYGRQRRERPNVPVHPAADPERSSEPLPRKEQAQQDRPTTDTSAAVEPDDEVALQDLRTAMRDCLKQLPEEERLVLILRYWLDWTLAAMAEMLYEGSALAAAMSSVWRLLGRAKNSLKTCLSRKGYSEADL